MIFFQRILRNLKKTQTQDEDDIFGAKTQDEDDIFGDTKTQDEPKKTSNTSNVEDTKKLTSTSSTSKLPKFPIKKEDLPQNQTTKQPEKPKEDEDDIFSKESNTNTQKTKFEDELKQKAKIIQNEDKIKSETPIKNPKIEQRPPLTLVPDFVETHTPKKNNEDDIFSSETKSDIEDDEISPKESITSDIKVETNENTIIEKPLSTQDDNKNLEKKSSKISIEKPKGDTILFPMIMNQIYLWK